MEETIRRARVKWLKDGKPLFDHETLQSYLPSNYDIVAQGDGYLYIEGQDVAGWTLSGYVIPRLASGLIWAEEVKES